MQQPVFSFWFFVSLTIDLGKALHEERFKRLKRFNGLRVQWFKGSRGSRGLRSLRSLRSLRGLRGSKGSRGSRGFWCTCLTRFTLYLTPYTSCLLLVHHQNIHASLQDIKCNFGHQVFLIKGWIDLRYFKATNLAYLHKLADQVFRFPFS